MQVGGLGRLLPATLLAGGEVQLAPGRPLLAKVISVFADRAILSLGQGARLEVRLETPLTEGEQVRLRVAEVGAEQILLRLEEPPARPEAQPQLLWFPLPLPNGAQGWVQLRVEPEAKGEAQSSLSKLSLWWESPLLGPIRAELEAHGEALSARLGTARPETQGRLNAEIEALTERLTAAGFTRVSAGARLLPRDPAPEGGAGRLDQRG